MTIVCSEEGVTETRSTSSSSQGCTDASPLASRPTVVLSSAIGLCIRPASDDDDDSKAARL